MTPTNVTPLNYRDHIFIEICFRIDNDILNLMDEFDFDLLVKELTDSIGDSEKFMSYLTERSVVIVERFLVRLRIRCYDETNELFGSSFYDQLLPPAGLPSKNVHSN